MTDILEYKCPACGAPVKYDAGKERIVCEFCDATFTADDVKRYDEELRKEAPEETDWDKGQEPEELTGDFTGLNCTSCGAEIVGDSNTAANECPYCGNTNIIKKRISGIYKPDYIIPFKVTQKEAIEALSRHYKGKRLLPDAFTKDNRVEKVQGVYVPFWLVDGVARVDAMFEASKVARAWCDSEYDYKKINYYSLVRRGGYTFSRVPADASDKMADDLMESIEPFDCSAVKDFSPAYLPGYLTDKYDVEKTQGKKRTAARIVKTAQTAVEESLGGYTVSGTQKCLIRVTESKISYALFPVWLLTTRYKDTPYTFAMNGQTGKFTGNLPIDKGKLNTYMLAAFLAGAGVSYIFLKYALTTVISAL